jgi:hypothetical protein
MHRDGDQCRRDQCGFERIEFSDAGTGRERLYIIRARRRFIEHSLQQFYSYSEWGLHGYDYDHPLWRRAFGADHAELFEFRGGTDLYSDADRGWTGDVDPEQ